LYELNYDQFENVVPPYGILVPRPVFPLHRVSTKGPAYPLPALSLFWLQNFRSIASLNQANGRFAA
jgi:hypothetical protein